MDALRLKFSRENSPNILKNLILVIIKTEPIFLNRNFPSYEMNTVVSLFLIMLPLTQRQVTL